MATILQNNQNDSRFINNVCSNTKTDFIEITEDKLENILTKFVQDIKKSTGWLTPLSIFLTILVVHLTTEFKDFLTIPKEVWSAMFYLCLAISLCWFFSKIIHAFKTKKKTDIQFLINKIKNNQ